MRKDRRFRTFLEDAKEKKERKPHPVFLGGLSSSEEVTAEDEVLELARDRLLDDGPAAAVWLTAAAARAAAASCSLEWRRSARRRRSLSGLRRRWSRGIIVDRLGIRFDVFRYGPFICGWRWVCVVVDTDAIGRGCRSFVTVVQYGVSKLSFLRVKDGYR